MPATIEFAPVAQLGEHGVSRTIASARANATSLQASGWTRGHRPRGAQQAAGLPVESGDALIEMTEFCARSSAG